ncbi:hypothetical protein VPNG_05377 [Cytospora leucostoma]|uniref:Uncharacterized protein n=1 Tax=Cytospora leucostoma TaxID=1230097 RepID=A0A423X4Q5_9PEZI|nr:hypothetical protein VPNG_05377 [Cytospora leucostoma]
MYWGFSGTIPSLPDYSGYQNRRENDLSAQSGWAEESTEPYGTLDITVQPETAQRQHVLTLGDGTFYGKTMELVASVSALASPTTVPVVTTKNTNALDSSPSTILPLEVDLMSDDT